MKEQATVTKGGKLFMGKGKRSQSNIIAKECIVSALLQLIYVKPLSSITISELTEKAGVSRMTFYRNYESKEDIFISELAELMERYREEDGRLLPAGTYYDRGHMKHCFEYLYECRQFLNGLVYCGFGDMFLKKLREFVVEKWSGQYQGQKERYKLEAFSGTLYSLYISWAAADFAEPVAYMADILEEIYGIRN